MSELTNSTTPTDKAAEYADANKTGVGTGEEGVTTDVEGVKADDVIKQGSEEYPVFNVDQRWFYSNMDSNRKRMRFPSGSSVQQYVQKTRNTLRPFFIRTTTSDGKSFTRKIR